MFGTSTNAFGERKQWHKHDLGGRVDMPREREEHLLYIGTKRRATFFLCGYILMHSCNVDCCDCRVFVCILGTSRKALGEGISVALARFRRQRGHAKGTRGVRKITMGKTLLFTAWMCALLIIETPKSQSVDLFTCQWERAYNLAGAAYPLNDDAVPCRLEPSR